MPESWYPWAAAEPGPNWKTGAGDGRTVRDNKGAVLHSAEGYLEGAVSVLHGPRQASWHFTLCQDGRVFQHYPLEAITWHAGAANDDYVGIEHEGVAGQPLTPPQIEAGVNLLKWIALQDDWPAFERSVTLFEHNEFMATSCPSGRIPWDVLIGRLVGPPAPPRNAQLSGLIAALFVVSVDHPLSDLAPQDREAVRYVASLL